MRRIGLIFGLVLGLSACAELPATAPAPAAQPAPATAPAPQPVRAPRAVAREFVAVVEQVEPVAEQECRRRSPRLNCDFRIVVDDRPNMPANAFQTEDDTGRPILAVTVALLQDARNADELAFVLAHEAAHHIAGHLELRRRNATLGAVVFGELAGTLGTGEVRTAQELGAFIGARAYSQSFELEADKLGTIIAARAGYDPVRGAEFFFRIPDPGDTFLSTHPANAARVEIVRETAAELGL